MRFLDTFSQDDSFYSNVASCTAKLALDLSSGSLISNNSPCYPTKIYETRASLILPSLSGHMIGALECPFHH